LIDNLFPVQCTCINLLHLSWKNHVRILAIMFREEWDTAYTLYPCQDSPDLKLT
jgi:hypothetical protein